MILNHNYNRTIYAIEFDSNVIFYTILFLSFHSPFIPYSKNLHHHFGSSSPTAAGYPSILTSPTTPSYPHPLSYYHSKPSPTALLFHRPIYTTTIILPPVPILITPSFANHPITYIPNPITHIDAQHHPCHPTPFTHFLNKFRYPSPSPPSNPSAAIHSTHPTHPIPISPGNNPLLM